MTAAGALRRGPAPPPHDPARHAPAFVVAPARSFSSVVATMIGGHPELYGFPELTMFDQATVGERLRAEPALPAGRRAGWNPVGGLLRALAQLHDGRQDADAVAAASAWLEERAHWPCVAVLDHLFELVEPLVPVEKSPATVASEDGLARLRESFPRARVVHLVRHPVTTVRSMQTAFLLSDYPVHCVRGWVAAHRRILELGASLPEGAVLRVRGEDVLNRPDGELARIARWLGVRDDDEAVAAMRQPQCSPYAKPGPAEAAGGHDPLFLDHPTPHTVAEPDTLELPAEWDAPADLQRAVTRLGLELGYR